MITTVAIKKRVSAVSSVKGEAAKKLQGVLTQPKYSELLQALVVQGAFVLEGDALVSCRQEDMGKINLQSAAAAAEERLREAGRPRKLTLEFNKAPCNAPLELGGVFLCLAGDSKITCDNTLASRLATCMEEYAPILRHNLFQEAKIQSA